MKILPGTLHYFALRRTFLFLFVCFCAIVIPSLLRCVFDSSHAHPLHHDAAAGAETAAVGIGRCTEHSRRAEQVLILIVWLELVFVHRLTSYKYFRNSFNNGGGRHHNSLPAEPLGLSREEH